MACPFSRRHVPVLSDQDDVVRQPGQDSTRDAGSQNRRLRAARQSSVQITSFLGDEIDDQENTQTLNLKHLRAAVLVLTNPSVRILRIISGVGFLNGGGKFLF